MHYIRVISPARLAPRREVSGCNASQLLHFLATFEYESLKQKISMPWELTEVCQGSPGANPRCSGGGGWMEE